MKPGLPFIAVLLALFLAGSPVAGAQDRDSTAVLADSLIHYAMKYKGTPYRLGAVGPKEFDCSSFVRHVYAGIGMDIPRYTWTQIKAGREVKRIHDLQRGDLVFFGKRRGVRDIGHIGIVVDMDPVHSDFVFIHCGTSSGVELRHYSYPYFLMRYITARRLLPDIPVEE